MIIPNEILVKILNLIDYTNRKKLSLVCKLFNYLITNEPPIKVVLKQKIKIGKIISFLCREKSFIVYDGTFTRYSRSDPTKKIVICHGKNCDQTCNKIQLRSNDHLFVNNLHKDQIFVTQKTCLACDYGSIYVSKNESHVVVLAGDPKSECTTVDLSTMNMFCKQISPLPMIFSNITSAIDSKKDLYISNCYKQRIKKYHDRVRIKVFKVIQNYQNKYLFYPKQIVIDKQDRIFITSTNGDPIQIFNTNGKLIQILESCPVKNPIDIVFDSLGNMVISDGRSLFVCDLNLYL